MAIIFLRLVWVNHALLSFLCSLCFAGIQVQPQNVCPRLECGGLVDLSMPKDREFCRVTCSYLGQAPVRTGHL